MKKRIISLDITSIPYSEFIDKICYLAAEKISSYICVANVHMCIEAYDDAEFQNIVNNADMVTPDGMPLAKGIQWLYGKEQERVAGMDLLPDLLKECEKQSLKVYFYGGSENTQKSTELFIHQNYTKLEAVGYYSPPFRKLSSEEEIQIIHNINNSGAQLVFVALGCPKQEKWMASMKGKINACMIGIGGALPVLIGEQKRAPQWMQNLSLEWFYRFVQEPKRLFKRYAYTNSKFIFLLLKQKFFLKT